jgi:uncharacterized protein with FMN-binding domain
MKKFFKVIFSIFILFVVLASGGMFYLSRGLDNGSKLEINEVKLSTLSDGVYNGKYEAGRWTNEVVVTVKDHKIVKIDLVKDVLFSKPEVTREIFNKVIEKQNTMVDAISSSTVTSKAYLKSIENALKN